MMAILEPESKEVRRRMVETIIKARGFVVFRSSPKQKALLVGFVKNSVFCVTCAIGDGANDVNMI